MGDKSGRKTLEWADTDLPPLILACPAKSLHQITLVVCLFGYSRDQTRRGKSKLCASVQLRLTAPDASGRVGVCTAPLQMEMCAANHGISLEFTMHAVEQVENNKNRQRPVANRMSRMSRLGSILPDALELSDINRYFTRQDRISRFCSMQRGL